MGYQTLDVRPDGRVFGYIDDPARRMLGIPAVQDFLKALADLRDADHERNLPATIVQSLPVAAH